MVKTYNTPKRNHIVKTRLDDEEHADFLRRLEIYDMNQIGRASCRERV